LGESLANEARPGCSRTTLSRTNKFEHLLFLRYQLRVRRFWNIVLVVAALLWLPASAHCQLEFIPGLQFLACASDGSVSENESSHCDDANCCSIERSQYRTEIFQIALITLAPSFSNLLLADALKSLPVPIAGGVLTAAPPELLQPRHFISRAALPVRAPSLVS